MTPAPSSQEPVRHFDKATISRMPLDMPASATTFPETALSKLFQLSVVDQTKTVDGDAAVFGTIEVQYVIPANIDYPTARAEVIKACKERGDRSRPAISSSDLEWYKNQEREKGDNSASARVVKFIIDFDSKDPGDGTMNMAGHRAYAKSKDAHLTPVERLALGAALFYEKTGLDLMKGCWVRAVVSDNFSVPGVALTSYPVLGISVLRHCDGHASFSIVAALSST